ncbi:alpha-ketoglutarate-dependent dioxygenase AlkB [Novosphingobium sp. RD2P27]|uniref:Alpha-ketoglutarate-dependent dioxygenase AlkB n=1 Tax=Novosphingobium kalidii TaxID=3230299 RepID=A0ABV2CY61_9SPHN
MSIQRDLFGFPLLPGLATHLDIVSTQEEPALIDHIRSESLLPFRFQGWFGKRLTRSFGWSYDFESGRFIQTDAIPGWLLPLRDRAADFSQLAPEALAQALLIRYDAGAGIGWHKDKPVFEHVVGVSLGSPAEMRLRRRNSRAFSRLSLPLVPRSAYHLSGEARHEWEHSIAPMASTRWSITFRSLARV